MKKHFVGKPEDLLTGKALEETKDFGEVRVFVVKIEEPSKPTVRPRRKLIPSRKKGQLVTVKK